MWPSSISRVVYYRVYKDARQDNLMITLEETVLMSLLAVVGITTQ